MNTFGFGTDERSRPRPGNFGFQVSDVVGPASRRPQEGGFAYQTGRAVGQVGRGTYEAASAAAGELLTLPLLAEPPSPMPETTSTAARPGRSHAVGLT